MDVPAWAAPDRGGDDLKVDVLAKRKQGVVRAQAGVAAAEACTDAGQLSDALDAILQIGARVDEVVNAAGSSLRHSICASAEFGNRRAYLSLIRALLRVAAEWHLEDVVSAEVVRVFRRRPGQNGRMPGQDQDGPRPHSVVGGAVRQQTRPAALSVIPPRREPTSAVERSSLCLMMSNTFASQ